MEDKKQDLHKGQLFRKEDIERTPKDDHGDNQQSTMPTLEDIVGIVEDEKTLDLNSSLKRG